MKRKWRLKVFEQSCYNYWCTFELTPEKHQLLTDLNAIVYPFVDLIMFRNTEDIIVFSLKGGLDDIE